MRFLYVSGKKIERIYYQSVSSSILSLHLSNFNLFNLTPYSPLLFLLTLFFSFIYLYSNLFSFLLFSPSCSLPFFYPTLSSSFPFPSAPSSLLCTPLLNFLLLVAFCCPHQLSMLLSSVISILL